MTGEFYTLNFFLRPIDLSGWEVGISIHFLHFIFCWCLLVWDCSLVFPHKDVRLLPRLQLIQHQTRWEQSGPAVTSSSILSLTRERKRERERESERERERETVLTAKPITFMSEWHFSRKVMVSFAQTISRKKLFRYFDRNDPTKFQMLITFMYLKLLDLQQIQITDWFLLQTYRKTVKYKKNLTILFMQQYICFFFLIIHTGCLSCVIYIYVYIYKTMFSMVKYLKNW